MTSVEPADGIIPPLLRVRGLTKAFGVTRALIDSSIDLHSGEVHILLGENGAGKSTLAKIIAGLVRRDTGSIEIGGKLVSIDSTKDARRYGIAIVFQELSLVPHLSIVDNLFLGAESNAFPYSLLRRREEIKRSRETLAALELDIDPQRLVGELSIAQKQTLEIAKALLQDPRILIMDEPTSTLTEKEKGHLFRVLKRLQNQGVAILYVTHHLREVFQIGSRVSAMRDGAVKVTTKVTADLNESQLLEMLTGRKLSTTVQRTPRQNRERLLEVEEVWTDVGCRGVSLVVHPGEVVGVYGVVGCGREQLGQVLVGLTPVISGVMRFGAKQFQPKNPANARSRGVGYLPMDRKERGILSERPIQENLTLSCLSRVSRNGVIDSRIEKQEVLDLLRELRVHYHSMDDRITSLSGGNQQKVLFGRAIAHKPQVLVMEDPTSGIDMGAKFDLYEILRNLADDGLSFLLLSSDLAETLLLCDRVYTMYQGRFVGELVSPTLEDEEKVLSHVLGYGEGSTTLPQATH
jgi:ribose transport system ATP-binding protein